LNSEFATEILNVIELNKKIMETLDQEEEITCSVCENININTDCKYKRKDYYDHWKTEHFGNDKHLLLLINKPEIPQDANFSLLPPELTTEEALELQRQIEEEIQQERERRVLLEMRITRIRDKEKRIEILNSWKELWNEARKLRDYILPRKINKISNFEWEELHKNLDRNIDLLQTSTSEMFNIYQNENRIREIKPILGERDEVYNLRKEKINDGNEFYKGDLKEYVAHLKMLRDQNQEKYYCKYKQKCQRRKINRYKRFNSIK
jgi:hypothetical protein